MRDDLRVYIELLLPNKYAVKFDMTPVMGRIYKKFSKWCEFHHKDFSHFTKHKLNVYLCFFKVKISNIFLFLTCKRPLL